MIISYSKMTDEQISEHVYADSHKWKWLVDENGDDVPPELGCDARYAKRASQEDEDMLAELLGKR